MSSTDIGEKADDVEEIAGMLIGTNEDLQNHIGMPISDLRALGFEVYEDLSPGLGPDSPGINRIATRKKTAAERADELSLEFSQRIPIEHMDSQQYAKYRLSNLSSWVRSEARIRILKALRAFIHGEAKKQKSFHGDYLSSEMTGKE